MTCARQHRCGDGRTLVCICEATGPHVHETVDRIGFIDAIPHPLVFPLNR